MRTIEADKRAVRATLTLLTAVTTDDLSRPTPCAGWDLGALLAHMTAQHQGFAAAAAGYGADPAAWQPSPFPPQAIAHAADRGLVGDGRAGQVAAVRRYAEAAERVIAAFAVPGVLERAFVLPEVAGDRPVPASIAIGFHLVDYVVHGWDVARALGLPFELPAEVLALALPVAQAVPGGAGRLVPGAAFGPARPSTDDSDPLTKIITLLGRSPMWTVEKMSVEADTVFGHGARR
jgi:uncharacterized protein (TIGR03086 family)